LTDRRITRCRFVQQNKVTLCADGTLRSALFEFDHPDFSAFLRQCTDITAHKTGDRVVLTLHDNDLITLDWFNFAFVGDSGNFSKADKLQFVQLHLNVLKQLLRGGAEPLNLFALCKDDDKETNYLVLTRKNYLDAGGVYEPENRFYAREFFLVVALQNYQHLIRECLSSRRLDYNLTTDWMPVSAAFAALISEYPRPNWLQLSTRLSNFGDKGKTLTTAQAR
jgi:hypothetical protein